MGEHIEIQQPPRAARNPNAAISWFTLVSSRVPKVCVLWRLCKYWKRIEEVWCAVGGICSDGLSSLTLCLQAQISSPLYFLVSFFAPRTSKHKKSPHTEESFRQRTDNKPVNVGHLLHFLEQEEDSFQEIGISQQLEIEITTGPKCNFCCDQGHCGVHISA